MIQLRKSSPADVPALQELFQLCFGDGPEVSGLYFNLFYRPEEFLVLFEDGELRAMAGLLHVTLTEPDGNSVKAAYLYGMGTHPDHQGRGFASQLLNYADFYLHGKRDCIVTMPATAELHSFYAKFGFSECFPLLEGEMTPRTPRERESSLPLDAAAYDDLREQLLAQVHHVSYGALTGLQEQLCHYSHGSLLSLNVDGIPGCAAVEHWGDTAICKEVLIAPNALEGALALIAQAVCAQKFIVRSPVSQPHAALAQRDFGMIKWYDPIAAKRWQSAATPYLGLAFD